MFTFVVWKADRKRGRVDLPFKQIFFVEEEDDGCLNEPLVIADRFEELHRLVHAILVNKKYIKKPKKLPTISSSSAKTRSYAESATQKMIAVTPSKQWIHFFLSDLCPPTSYILI